ncbi:hypothetical protein BSU01_06335 [Erwinia billingiae]|jgi:multidrug efflux system outer membrane protein|uniref:TolC family protein n=1 Tax=Erwinia billingiae TaxID=182337 RepID=UPI0019D30446|nr:TolC family protein [Erwinia billingiae]MBN7121330.1 hypothetical protein [Erwinia billingiae]
MSNYLTLKTLVIASTCLLSGCSLAPEYVRPQSRIDPVVDLKLAQNSGSYHFHDLYRDDKPLLDILDHALLQNYDLEEAVTRVESARAQKLSSIFDLIPSLNYTASKTTAMNSVTSPLTSGVIKQKSESYQGRVGFDSWDVDVWGKKLSEIQSLQSSKESYQSLVAQVRLTLMSDLAQAWYEALSMIQIWHILQNKQAQLLDIEAKLKQIDSLGRLEPIVLTKFLRGQGNDESTLQNLRLEILARIHKLEYLSGYSSPALNVGNWQQAMNYSDIPELPQGIRSDIILNRPDVIAAEWKIKAANGSIGSARAAFLPGVNLFARAWQTSGSFDGVVGSFKENWTLTPSVMIPIFDLPKHYANLKYAETQQKLAIIDYRRTIAKSLMEIKEATDSLRISQENVAIVRKELASQSESFTKNKLRYDAGYADLYTYYEALDIFTSTKIELESKRQQVILNSVAVLNVIGG